MPIVNVEGLGKVEFPDSMNSEQIDAAIKREILPLLSRAQVATLAPGFGVVAPGAVLGANPFSKGTAFVDTNYRIGDSYTSRIIDLLTKVEVRTITETVTAITDTEIIYNRGSRITDFLGNNIKAANGQTFTGSQIIVAEYKVGKKWTARFRGTRLDLKTWDETEIDFKVVDKEKITVPAGTFDCFKVEGRGFVKDAGTSVNHTYWIAPDLVRRPVVFEIMARNRGRYLITNRTELVAYKQGA
jgi:hypothetical protein